MSKNSRLRLRRLLIVGLVLGATAYWLIINPASYEAIPVVSTPNSTQPGSLRASTILAQLQIKGRAPKTNYNRKAFYARWPAVDGCSLRQKIIKRELGATAILDGCNVISGEFDEPYTGLHKTFTSKNALSRQIQIDHVVALSDAWQKGAQYWPADKRFRFATDPLNLLAVDSAANQQKSDGDAATWLPPNRAFRCPYVARQVSIKYNYELWLTQAEHDAMAQVLQGCPTEPAIGVKL